MLFIMDAYLQILYECIIVDITDKIESYNSYSDDTYSRCPTGLYELVREVEGLSDITFNFNEEGRLHSRYLGDRYEPAIIIQHSRVTIYYYLFDGKIKDCVHPFSIDIYTPEKIITYYSSERIKQELPVSIIKDETIVTEIYNEYNSESLLAGNSESLLTGHMHGRIDIDIADYPEQDYFLHDCMEPVSSFKFAD